MSHRYRQRPPSTRMYRHFAVITLTVTGLLALFAEGEKAEAVTRQVEVQSHEEQAQTASEPQQAPQPAIQQPGGVWGDDGSPFGNALSSGSVSSWWPELSARGYSPEYLAQMSDEERRALEAAIAENTGSSPSGNRVEIARLEAASSARSGSAGRQGVYP